MPWLQDILKQANDDGLTCASELPYFDGDFWPNALEDSIRELDQEEEERKASAAAAEASGKDVSMIPNRSFLEAFQGVFFVAIDTTMNMKLHARY